MSLEIDSVLLLSEIWLKIMPSTAYVQGKARCWIRNYLKINYISIIYKIYRRPHILDGWKTFIILFDHINLLIFLFPNIVWRYLPWSAYSRWRWVLLDLCSLQRGTISLQRGETFTFLCDFISYWITFTFPQMEWGLRDSRCCLKRPHS